MSVALKDTFGSPDNTMISTEEIRRCFPALARTYNGYPVAYFDGPGGTQVPQTVVEAMNNYRITVSVTMPRATDLKWQSAQREVS